MDAPRLKLPKGGSLKVRSGHSRPGSEILYDWAMGTPSLKLPKGGSLKVPHGLAPRCSMPGPWMLPVSSCPKVGHFRSLMGHHHVTPCSNRPDMTFVVELSIYLPCSTCIPGRSSYRRRIRSLLSCAACQGWCTLSIKPTLILNLFSKATLSREKHF